MKKTLLYACSAFFGVALSSLSTFASGTDTWVGNTDANWNTAANWTAGSGGSTPPANGDSLVFGAAGSSGASLTNNVSGLSINKLTFNSGASSFTFYGNGFTNGTGGIDASALTSGTETINGTIAIAPGLQRWNVGAGVTLSLGSIGVLGGDAADLFTPNGAVVIISKTGTIKTTTADGWGWRSGAVAGTGLLGPGAVIDNGDNTYDWASVGSQTAGTSRTIVAPTYTTAVNTDAHNVKVTGNTTVAPNASWASLLVNNATLTANTGGSLFLDTGIILENGGTISGSAPVKANADGLYIYVSNTGTISSSLQNNGSTAKFLYKSGAGTLSLTGNNSYTAGTVIYDGTLSVGNASALGSGALSFKGGNLDCSSANLTLNNNISQNWNADFTFVGSQNLNLGTGAVTLNGTRQVTVTANTLTVGGVISGSTFGLTKAGGGTLKVSGVNTYTGATTVNAGTLEIATSGTGIASGSTVTVNSTGTLLVDSGATVGSSTVAVSGGTVRGAGTVSGATTINSSGALTPRPSGGSATTLTFGGNLTLSSALANFSLSSSSGGSNDKVVYGSSGTLTLDNTDTITVTNSVLDTANDYTLFTSTSGTVSMTTTPVLKVNGTTSDQTSTGNYKLQISGDGHSMLLHYIAAAVPPTVNSASASPASLGHYQTTTITVNVTPASGQSISSVTVTADGLAGAGDPVTLTGPGGNGSGNWTGTFIAAGGLAAGSYTISGAVNQSDGGVVAWSVSSIMVTNAGPVWNGGGLDNKWSTGGNWDIGHGPGYGDTAVLAGTVQLTNNLDASLSLASLTFDSTAGSFAITNDGSTLTLTGGMTNNSTSAQTIAVPVAIGGAQMVNTASGDIAIGRVVSGAGAALTKVGPGTLTLSAVNTYGGATTIGNGTLTITGAGQLGAGAYSAVITNNGALNFSGSASQTLSGIISGAGSLTNGSSGTLTLSAANSYSGGSKLNSGTSKFSNASAFGTGTITLNGGTLQAGGGYTLTNNIIASSASTVDMAANNTAFTGNLSGSGAVTFNNSSFASTITLSGNNSSYGGTITLNNNNAVSFGSASAGSGGAAWVFNDNAGDRVRINIGNGTIQFGSLGGSGQMQNDTAGTASIISVGALNTSTTFGGTMKDNGTGTLALTKVGGGTLTLSGGNTYTGNTTISNGVLALSGSGSIANSANIILLGATFDVSALSSTFTLGSGKTLIATNNATGTVAGNLSLGSGSLVLNYTNGTPSLLVTNGTFTFNNNAVAVTVSGTQLPGGSYKLIAKATAGTAGSVAGTLPSSVTVNGAGAASAASLQIINGELYLVVNHPPVANTMNVTRTAGLSVKIAWTDLMTNWSDADADAISLTSFNLVTTNGVTLQTNGTWILYTNNVNVTDRFTYTITDAQGAAATGAVNILVNGSVTGTNSITAIVNGNPTTLTAYGIPGYSYITQRSTNLVDWVDISTNVAATNGVLTVTDGFSDLGGPPSSAYYRLEWQP